MITAEHSPNDVRIVVNPVQTGPLPVPLGSYYTEVSVVNYLGMDLCVVDFRNRSMAIAQSPHQFSNAKYVEVLYRHHVGTRTVGRHGHEDTPSKHYSMLIEYDVLRRQPVFVEELNAVLCLPDQLEKTLHPHSEQAILEAHHRIEDAVAACEAPFVLLANDPTGRVDHLFTEVNGEICSVAVTHYKQEPDYIVIGVRNKPHDPKGFTKFRSHFWEMREKNSDHIWELGGFKFSISREWLEQRLLIERGRKPETIPLDAVGKIVEEAQAVNEEMITQLRDDNKHLTQKLKVSEAAYEELKKGGYDELKARYDLAALQMQQAKLEAEARNAEYRQRAQDAEAKQKLAEERAKAWKELYATIGSVAKTLAIVVPVGIGLYKAVSAMRNK